MSQKVVNRTTGLVDYKELEANILLSIREGRPLTGRDGAFTPLIKKLLEASLEGEIENHLLAESEENNRRNGRNGKTLRTSAHSLLLDFLVYLVYLFCHSAEQIHSTYGQYIFY